MSKKTKGGITYDADQLSAIIGDGTRKLHGEELYKHAQFWADALNQKLPKGWRATVRRGHRGAEIQVRKVKGG